MRIIVPFAALAAISLSACGSSAAKDETRPWATLKHEAACDLADLPRPQRQTILVIDEESIVRSTSSDFRRNNPGMLDAVLAVADPEQAVELGALAPRERVSLFLAPRDGSAPRLMFTGCAPALSPEDLRIAQSGSSSLERGKDTFFATGIDDQVAGFANEYRSQLLGAVQHIAQTAPEAPGRAAERFEQTPLVRSIRAASRMYDPLLGSPRFVFVAPGAMRSVAGHADRESARRAGFASAKETGLDLGMAQVSVALAGAANRDFVEAFLLGSRGQLESWSTAAPTNLGPPPVSLREFGGTIQYGPVQFPVRARLAVNKDGVLTNSWIVVMNEHEAATPISGSAACDANGDCTVTGDGRGFSQLWSPQMGGQPEFAAELPFSGLRYFEMKVRRGRAAGRIYDPLVDQIGDDPTRKALTFEMVEKS